MNADALPDARSDRASQAASWGRLVNGADEREPEAPFQAVHLGEQDVLIGDLQAMLVHDPDLCPPRSGHIGNWSNIEDGRAGAMDFNNAICSAGYGYPLLYCFTQTETASPRSGDWGYLPGSRVAGDGRTLLPLRCWQGSGWATCDHAMPRFVPFLQTESEGGSLPLLTYHADRLRRLGPRPYLLEQAIFAQHEHRICSILDGLLEQARYSPNPKRDLQDMVSHAVTRDGRMQPCTLVLDGHRGFRFGEIRFATSADLIERIMLPCQAVLHPRAVLSSMGDMPDVMLLMSSTLTALLSAYLETHRPGRLGQPKPEPTDRIVHLHWGGRDMAGHPPVKRGYLMESGRLRSLKRLCTSLARAQRLPAPLSILLLPAVVYNLLPSSAHPNDAVLLTELFQSLRAQLARGACVTSRYESIRAAVESWNEVRGALLSPYFKARFGPRTGGLMGSDFCSGHPTEPEGWKDLTLFEASMLVGALYEALGRQAR